MVDTKVDCEAGRIYIYGDQYVIRPVEETRPGYGLFTYRSKNFTDITPQEMAGFINESVKADNAQTYLKDWDGLPIKEFKSREGVSYEAKVGVNLQTGVIYTFNLEGMNTRQDAGHGQDRSRQQSQGRGQERGGEQRGQASGGYRHAAVSGRDEARMVLDDAQDGGIDNMGTVNADDFDDHDIPDHINDRPAPAPARTAPPQIPGRSGYQGGGGRGRR